MNTATTEKKDGRGRPEYKRNDYDLGVVEALSLSGVNQNDIAKMIKITKKTLTKHYREELDTTSMKRNSQVVGRLYQDAIRGNTTAGIFIAKTQLGWKETTVSENTGVPGVVVVEKPMTKEEWLKEFGGEAGIDGNDQTETGGEQ